MHLLNTLVHQVKVLSQPTQMLLGVFLKLFPQLIEQNIHSLIGQPNLVYHSKYYKTGY